MRYHNITKYICKQLTVCLYVLSYVQDVESLGHKLGFSEDIGNFHIVSLGQGQEVIAEQAMEFGSLKGHWVMLQVT